MSGKQNVVKNFLASKWVIGLLVLMMLLLLRLQYVKWQERRAVSMEIERLKQEEESWRKKNDDLEQSLEFVSSLGYKEKVARQQLNLKKDGEIVLGVSEDNREGQKELQNTTNTRTDFPTSNVEVWWKYFFSK